MVKNRAHDEGCCGARFLRYILFIFNFLFYLAALCVLGLGLYTLFARSQYNALLPSALATYITYALCATGLLALVVGLFGCTAMWKDSKCALLAFSLSLLVLFLVEAGVSVLSYVHAGRVQSDLHRTLNGTLQQKYGLPGHDDVTLAADRLQIDMYCCGGQDFRDWRKSQWYEQVNADTAERGGKPLRVPSACCRDTAKLDNCGLNDHPSFIYPDGCWLRLGSYVRDWQVVLAGAVLGLSLVQLFGLLVTCCLYCRMDDEDEDVQRRLASSY